MIRVSTHVTKAGETVIMLEGQASTEAVAEISAAINAAGTGCVIDLSGVRSIDAPAVAFIVGVERRGVRLRGASMYVRALIEEQTS